MKQAIKLNMLTPMQEGLLFHTLLNEEGMSYYEQICINIEGDVNVNLLKKAWQSVIDRYEILRTDFLWKQVKEPVQVVLKEKEAELYIYDTSNLTELEQEKYIRNFKKEDLKQRFDFEKGILNRLSLVRLSSQKYLMCWTFHHILLDGWSVQIILEDLVNIYHSLSHQLPLPGEPKVQFSDYLDWLKGKTKKRGLKFWETYMKDFSEPSHLPYGSGVKKEELITDVVTKEIKFNEKKSIEISSFCKKNNLTLNTLFQTAWGVLLQKYNNIDESCFGVTVSGRSTEIEHIEDIVGMMMNTLPLIVKSEINDTVKDLLTKVNDQLVEIREYDYVSLAEIQQVSNYEKLFDSIFLFENYPMNSALKNNDLDFKLSLDSIFELSNYDLVVMVTVGDLIASEEKITLKFHYNVELFASEMIERMLQNMVQLIDTMMIETEKLVNQICIVSKTEKQRLFYEFNDTKVAYPKEKTILQLFEEQVLRTPDNSAVVFEDQKLTYQELNEKANQIAKVLREKGIGSDQIVAIMVEPSLEMIIGIMGILKAGGAYLPIDSQYPADRVEYMLNDSQAKILLTQHHLSDKIKFAGEIINIDVEKIEMIEDNNLTIINSANDLAYVIYTSGSTGKPKGVMVEHKSLVNLAIWHNTYYAVTFDDNTTKYAGFGFDASVWEIFPYLISGATIHIIGNEIRLDINKLNEYYESNKITISFLPTQMCEQFMEVDNNSLRFLLTGGDKLKNYRKQSYQLVNNYGPTENTVVTTSLVVNESYNNIPIGKPIANLQVYILDKNNKVQPIGVSGELCIAGDGLARGYLNRPELTEEKFVQNPFRINPFIPETRMYKTGDLARWLPDGNIEFLGRIDNQVKIRGFRIELGEIENQLLSHEEIKEAVVIDWIDDSGDKYLCAYIISDSELSIAELKAYLGRELPNYMVPADFVQLEKVPLTPNGKIDRRVLPKPDGNLVVGTEYVAPTNEAEEKMAIIWSQILHVDKIGINDNFFILGGHSLKATRLASKLLKEFNVEIPMKVIFKHPTIKKLVDYITGKEKTIYASIKPVEMRDPEYEYYPSGCYPVSSAQKRLFALGELEGDNIIYNIPSIMMVEGDIDKGRFEDTFITLVERHESFRTTFEVIDGEVVQRIHDDVNFEIEYIKSGSVDELETIIKRFIRPFDLSKSPLLRVGLVKYDEKHLLMLDMHHIISDGASMGIFFSEFFKLYKDQSLEELRIQYKDFSAWQNELI
ncbi:MAG: amino acid adenylation domain-containing protein, partial [Halanaerobiales bacterium]|nr:amino acid adenylation domain-containing protein [Halanaerobiales bacterium]